MEPGPGWSLSLVFFLGSKASPWSENLQIVFGLEKLRWDYKNNRTGTILVTFKTWSSTRNLIVIVFVKEKGIKFRNQRLRVPSFPSSRISSTSHPTNMRVAAVLLATLASVRYILILKSF